MISTPPDAVGATKPARQSDTSESSDDDQPTPAKKIKHEDAKSNYYSKIKYYVIAFTYTRARVCARACACVYINFVFSFSHTHQGRRRERRKKDHRHR